MIWPSTVRPFRTSGLIWDRLGYASLSCRYSVRSQKAPRLAASAALAFWSSVLVAVRIIGMLSLSIRVRPNFSL